MIYVRGQTVTETGTFQDPVSNAGVAVTSLKLRIIDPTGAERSPVTTGFGNPAPGVYTSLVVAALAGQWKCRWEASGSVGGACEDTFLVATSAFAPD